MTDINISILLATRGRTEALGRSIRSLCELAQDRSRIQIILGYDQDDQVGLDYWQTYLQGYLDQQKVPYTAMKFEPMGYTSLHRYNNKMAQHALGQWLVIWNDDAIMESQDWDQTIMSHNGRFRLLAFDTHNQHPYSIFPILPRKWFELLGYISPHPTQDGWLSQQAYLLDILERIPVQVKHDRYDLTGNNHDDTYLGRKMLEGNPSDPQDFHSTQQTNLRHRDAATLANYLKTQLGQDISFWENVWKGTQDPWQRLKANDVNGQMVQYRVSAHAVPTPPAIQS